MHALTVHPTGTRQWPKTLGDSNLIWAHICAAPDEHEDLSCLPQGERQHPHAPQARCIEHAVYEWLKARRDAAQPGRAEGTVTSWRADRLFQLHGERGVEEAKVSGLPQI